MKSEARDSFLEPNRQQAWVEWGGQVCFDKWR